jgi:hypothetical protein
MPVVQHTQFSRNHRSLKTIWKKGPEDELYRHLDSVNPNTPDGGGQDDTMFMLDKRPKKSSTKTKWQSKRLKGTSRLDWQHDILDDDENVQYLNYQWQVGNETFACAYITPTGVDAAGVTYLDIKMALRNSSEDGYRYIVT